MADVIYLDQGNGQLVEMQSEQYASEELLQSLLAQYPYLLAGSQMNEGNPRRWLLVGREIAIPWLEGSSASFALDHLLLDQDGIPTLIEVKRSTDTRIRREVVGQMLDYAANAVGAWSGESLRTKFEDTAKDRGLDSEQTLADFLMADAEDTSAQETFWQQVETNLHAGRIRMIFVADEIPAALRKIVEFLNTQMTQAEVLAIEVKQYTGQGMRTLVPRLLGQSVQRTSGAANSKNWDEEAYFQSLARNTNSASVRVVRRIVEWAASHSELKILWRGGAKTGSFTPELVIWGRRDHVFTIWDTGHVEVLFKYLDERGSLDYQHRHELLTRLNKIPGVKLPEDALSGRRNFPLRHLITDSALSQFLNDVAWAFDQMQARDGARRSDDL